MKKAFLLLLAVACMAPAAFARDMDPVVSVAWLEANLANPNLVVMDVRKVDDYKAGHIPGAVNVIGGALYVSKGGVNNEVPEMDDLSDTLSDAGVKAGSWVVVVETDSSRLAWATRVAWTLKYAGLVNVAFLDGGYAAWTKAGKAVSKDAVFRNGDYTAKAGVLRRQGPGTRGFGSPDRRRQELRHLLRPCETGLRSPGRTLSGRGIPALELDTERRRHGQGSRRSRGLRRQARTRSRDRDDHLLRFRRPVHDLVVDVLRGARVEERSELRRIIPGAGGGSFGQVRDTHLEVTEMTGSDRSR